MKTNQTIQKVAGALALIASFGILSGLTASSVQAASYGAQLETRVLSGSFYVTAGPAGSTPRKEKL